MVMTTKLLVRKEKGPCPRAATTLRKTSKAKLRSEDHEGATKACRDTDVHDDDGGNPAAEATNEAGINSKGC